MTYIANKLNGERIPPRGKKGKGWRNTSVRDVLFNPAYKGTQVVNVYQQHSRLPKEIPDSAIYIEIPPIVDEKLWNIAQERRKHNKHLKLPRNGHWLLQGLITCGLCGYGFRTEITHNRRQYGCRGRLKYTHVDGSPRCTSPRLDAENLEQEVWNRVEAIINDPNRLESVLKDTVSDLRNRETGLSARIQPIEQRLTQIAKQKERLADDWVQTNMNAEKYSELKSSLDQEEVRLRSVKNEIDPAQLEELEHTRNMLEFWQRQLQSMAWNTENEDGSMVRVVDKPHETALKIVGIEDNDLTKALFFPATKRELLDKVQVRLVVFMDRVEVKAIFPIEPIDCQLFRPSSR